MSAAEQHYVQVTYREPSPDDEGFIYNSWLKSFHENSPWARLVRSQIFYPNHKQVIAKILSESGVLIACNPENTEQIFGYGVFQPTSGNVAVLHYLYVKHPYRRLGIGGEIYRTILRLSAHDKELPTVASHTTQVWAEVLKQKWNMVYNPYVIGAFEQ